jgi:hypothetical protein
MTTTPDDIQKAAQERADWLVDAVAMCLQDRRFLRGDPEEDKTLTEAVFINGQKAISVAIARALLAERERRDAEIAALKADNERLRDALKPFASVLMADWSMPDDRYSIERKHFDRARVALEGK